MRLPYLLADSTAGPSQIISECGIAVFGNLSVWDGNSDIFRGVENSHKGTVS